MVEMIKELHAFLFITRQKLKTGKDSEKKKKEKNIFFFYFQTLMKASGMSKSESDTSTVRYVMCVHGQYLYMYLQI